jgi:hypothetical protein
MIQWLLRNRYKIAVIYLVKVAFLFPTTAQAVLYLDNFDTYTDGSALSGQGQWVNFGLGGSNFNVVATTSASSSPNTIQTGGNNRRTGVNYDVSTTTRVKFDYWWEASAGTQSNQIATLGGYIDSAGALTSYAELYVTRGGGVACIAFSGGCANNTPVGTLNSGWNSIQFDLTRVSTTSVVFKFRLNDVLSLDATTTIPITYNRFHPRINVTFSAMRMFDNYEYYTDGDVPPEPILACEEDPATRIIDFSPLDGETVSNPVTFSLDACIDPEDLGTIKGVNISLHNIDQNVLLLGTLSPSDIYLLDQEDIDIAGLFQFSTSTYIGEGNYRLEACIERSYFFGFIVNPFSDISDCISHQFVVGTSTYIGNISQRIFGDTNDFLNGLTATSSEALANTCNPLNSNFGIRECMTFLFIPDAYSLSLTMEDARTGILTRVPWGYFTRVINILSSTATSTLPAWTASIQVGAGNDMTPEITTITIDPADMLAGGASLLDSVQDPITNKTARDVFLPMVQLTVALAVIMTIISDLTSSHRHANEEKSRAGKLS